MNFSILMVTKLLIYSLCITGYKLHSLYRLSGFIHSFDLTKASVHNIHYLKDVKYNFQNCNIIGDRGYIRIAIQLDLFEKTNIKLEIPYRSK